MKRLISLIVRLFNGAYRRQGSESEYLGYESYAPVSMLRDKLPAKTEAPEQTFPKAA